MADNISEKKYENPGLRGPAMSARSSRRCGSSATWLFDTTIVHCEGAQWVRDAYAAREPARAVVKSHPLFAARDERENASHIYSLIFRPGTQRCVMCCDV